MKEKIELVTAFISLVANIAPFVIRRLDGKKVKAFYSWGVDKYTDELVIMNPSDQIIQIQYWTLVRRKYWFLYEDFTDFGFSEGEAYYAEIPAKSRKVVTLAGAETFELNPLDKEGRRLYLQVKLSDRRRSLYIDLTR